MVDKTITPIERAEIIHEKPPSGAYQEILFGSDTGNTLWILFSDRDGAAEWIGKFGCGVTSSMRVTKVIEPDRFFVFAGGFAYLVDATRRKLQNQYQGVFLEDVAYDPVTGHFIAGDTHLRIIEDGREIWASDRISVDGMYDMIVRDRVLTGMRRVDYDEGAPFSFDLDSREFHFGKAGPRTAP